METGAKKRVFRKLTTVTLFEIFEITKEQKFTTYHDKTGKRVQFKSRRAAERYCEKRGLCYIEIKHTFYG